MEAVTSKKRWSGQVSIRTRSASADIRRHLDPSWIEEALNDECRDFERWSYYRHPTAGPDGAQYRTHSEFGAGAPHPQRGLPHSLLVGVSLLTWQLPSPCTSQLVVIVAAGSTSTVPSQFVSPAAAMHSTSTLTVEEGPQAKNCVAPGFTLASWSQQSHFASERAGMYVVLGLLASPKSPGKVQNRAACRLSG